jgi:hypothetical protein
MDNCTICQKSEEIEQMKRDVAILKNENNNTKEDVRDIYKVIDKYNSKMISILLTCVGSLVLLIYNILVEKHG